jgi:hypothetical protein
MLIAFMILLPSEEEGEGKFAGLEIAGKITLLND